MAILIIGASGFVGQVLIPELLAQGHRVYGLSRHPPESRENLVPLVGDITQENLGLKEVPEDIDCLYHLAGVHSLGKDKDGSIWRTNVLGTSRVIDFCQRHKVSRLYFTSTAYTWECNPYGLSKIQNEKDIMEATRYGLKDTRLRSTIFKPSIIMGTDEWPYPGHFSQFVLALIKIHRRAELIRRKVEGALRLPVIEPVFRIKGNPQAKLNLVRVDMVAKAMASTKREGIYWLTNPDPPTLGELVDWISEFIMVTVKIMPQFKPTPIEVQFMKMTSAFEPYLQGDDFPSDIKDHPAIGRAFIHATIKRALLSQP